MKRFLFFASLIVMMMISLSLSSCTPRPATPDVDTRVTTETVKTTVSEDPGTYGFRVKKKIVIKGDTVWGYSKEILGSGYRWREIVEQNPFLKEPGRVYYDNDRKEWMALILPGEVINIGGKEISTPSYVVEEKTTTKETVQTVNTSQLSAVIPWWGWIVFVISFLVIVFILLGIAGLTTTIRNGTWRCYDTPRCDRYHPYCYGGGPSSMEFNHTNDGTNLRVTNCGRWNSLSVSSNKSGNFSATLNS